MNRKLMRQLDNVFQEDLDEQDRLDTNCVKIKLVNGHENMYNDNAKTTMDVPHKATNN